MDGSKEQGLHMLCMMYDLFAAKVAGDVYLEFLLHAYGCEERLRAVLFPVLSFPSLAKHVCEVVLEVPKMWRQRE